ncbi:MAG: FixH family protein [Pseudomonadota bacterium]
MRVVLACICTLLALGVQACEWPEADAVRSDMDTQLLYRFYPDKPVPGEFFTATLKVCQRGEFVAPQRISVDATMPAHGHGMNYRPTVAATGPSEYRVQGLLLHMQGLWRFEVRFKLYGERHRVVFDFAVQ